MPALSEGSGDGAEWTLPLLRRQESLRKALADFLAVLDREEVLMPRSRPVMDFTLADDACQQGRSRLRSSIAWQVKI